MVVEPTEFDIFGVVVDRKHILGIKSAMVRTYERLESGSQNGNAWVDKEFCKRQIGNLWEAIVDMLSRISSDPFQKKLRSENGFHPIVGYDNGIFLKILSEELKKEKTMEVILNQLNMVEARGGSLRLRWRDRLSQKNVEARIEVEKLMNHIKRESKKIENTLRHFVGSIKENKRQIITYSLVAGLLIISLSAFSAVAIPLLGVKLFIIASVTIVCLIAEFYGAYQTLSEIKYHLAQRTGVHLMEI